MCDQFDWVFEKEAILGYCACVIIFVLSICVSDSLWCYWLDPAWAMRCV